MGQAESSTPVHRVDPRWARVALAQLRDDEFLARQRRRQETLAGAAATSNAHRRGLHPQQHELFVDAPSSGGRALWTTLLKRKDAATDESEDAGESTQTATSSRDEKREDELVNALMLFGDLSQPKRAAYLLCHLQSQLERLCGGPDPIADAVALRRQILRDVCDAVSAQHNHYKSAALVFSATVEMFQRNDRSGRTRTNTSQGKVVLIPRDKADVDATFAASLVVEIVGRLLEMADNEVGVQKRVLFYEIAALVETLTPQSLVTTRRPPSSDEGGVDMRSLVQKLRQFLLAVVSNGAIPSVATGQPDDSQTNAEFDLADRTIALDCLVHLAAANASAGDFLDVVCVLLGVNDGSDACENSSGVLPHVASPSKAARSKYSPRCSVMKSPRSTCRDLFHHKEYDNGNVADDERIDPLDELANMAVEQRLKQVHKQRADQTSKGDFDGHTTAVDQLRSSQSKRRAVPKNLVVNQTKTAVANIVISNSSSSLATLSSHCTAIPHPPAHGTKTNSTAMKEDLNNISLEPDLNYSLDMALCRSESTTLHSPRHTIAASVSSGCPKFCALNVGSVLKAIDRVTPPAPSCEVVHGRSAPPGLSPDHHTHREGEVSDEDHEVWSCGQNSYGELGHGDANTRKTFERIEALQQRNIAQVCAGNEHTIVLSADGTVWTCGYNDNGQCGLGVTTRINHLTELQKLGDTPVTQVHAYNGCEHTIVIMQDGRAASCGYNYRGQLGHGNTQNESVPKIMRSIDGKYVRLVSCSYYHTTITCDSGSFGQSLVYTFGRNDYGQLGHSDTIDRKVPQCVEALQDQHIVSVACGQYHTMVVSSSGKLFAFGKNDYGQLGVDTVENQLTPVQVKSGLARHTCLEVHCGYYHSIVLCAGAHLFGFGRNDYGQLGIGKAVNSVSTNMQLQQQRYAKPQLLEDLEGKEITRFACGCYHTIAVSDNGILYVFGRNNHGQLGTGDTTERLFPFPIDDFVGKRVAMVAAGFYHTLVLTGGRDDADEEQDQNNRDVGKGVLPIDDRDGSGVGAFDCTKILSAPTVQGIYEAKVTRPRVPSFNKHSSLHARAASEERPASDSTAEADGDDGRSEDALILDSDEGIHNHMSDSSSSVQLLQHRGDGDCALDSGNISRSFGDSVDVAVIILAQMDRLSASLLPKRGSGSAVARHLPVAVAESLLVPNATLHDHVNGLFVPFTVDVSSSTFSSLSRLICHLSGRHLEAAGSRLFSHLSPKTTSRKPQPEICQMQQYLLTACFRILRANLLQLVRSGLGSILIAFQHSQHSSQQDSRDDRCALQDLSDAICRIRNILLGLVFTRVPISSEMDTSMEAKRTAVEVKIAYEANSILMLGIEVLFPCLCSRQALLMHVLDSSTQSDEVTCETCKQIKWSAFSTKNIAQRRWLMLSLLKRFADDSMVLKLFPLEGRVFSFTKKPFQALSRIAECLLERMSSEFLDGVSAIVANESSLEDTESSASLRTSSDESAADAIVSVLNGLLKHLAALAVSCDRWTRTIKNSPDATLNARLSAVVSQAFCVRPDAGGVTRSDDDFPIAWQGLLEISQRVVSHSCDVILQLLSRSQPSSARSIQNSNFPANVFTDAIFSERFSHEMQQSTVGKVLPAVVDSLFAFTHIPAFAVSLVHPLTALLKLLDQWNSCNEPIKLAADNYCTGQFGRVTQPSVLSTRHRPGEATAKLSQRTTPRGEIFAKASDALVVPWSLLLEKELAMLCTEFVVTTISGDALIDLVASPSATPPRKDVDDASVARWRFSLLFPGGISTDFIHDCVLPSSRESRTVLYSPAPFSVEPAPLATEFRLTLPPMSESFEDQDLHDAVVQDPSDPFCYMSIFQVRLFLAAMAGTTDGPSQGLRELARSLCEMMRIVHAKKDPTYRMLIRQFQQQQKVSQVPIDRNGQALPWSDTQLEEALFAALLHHHSLGMLALLTVVGRHGSLESSKTSERPQPKSLMYLWRSVAEFRRRFVAKRTAIRNSVELCEAQRVVAELQRAVIDRAHLLLLVNVDEEEEHRLCLLDGGFVAPWDPAYFLRASGKTQAPFSTSREIRSHMSSQYGSEMVSFLAAYPDSRWRRIRTLFHVSLRWKAAATAPIKEGWSALSSKAVEFVTADEAEIGDIISFAHDLFVAPCRAVACSARGFELLWELIQTPQLECVRVRILQQFAQTVKPSKFSIKDARVGVISQSNASFAYREMLRHSQNDFVASLLQLLVDKSRDVMCLPSELCQDQAAHWILSVVLRCLSQVHFTEDQFDFINDVGLLQVLQQIHFRDDGIHDGKEPNPSALNDSIRAINTMASSSTRDLSVDAARQQMTQVLWALMRSVALHFGSSSSVGSVMATKSMVPVYPSSPDVFKVLQLVGSRFLELSQAPLGRSLQERLNHASGSVNSSIRRSFEIIVAPRRFSFLAKGLTFAYAQMIEPASGLLAMSPLVKPSEFSITTWIYAASSSLSEPILPSVLDEKQIVFVRGNDQELSPYLLLTRDLDNKWHVEVGVAVHITHVSTLTSTRLLWERLNSKESIPSDQWTHVAVVLEGAKIRLYINGVLDNQRSLSGPLAVAINNGSVDLDFGFGRKTVETSISCVSQDDEVTRPQCRAPIAMEFLSALLAASSTTSKSLLTSPSDSGPPIRTFHGLLSHFRFHNRSLSPIHVRIVFDEKKPVKEDGVKTPISNFPEATNKILQLHSVLRILAESDEGRVHLADPLWTCQLWDNVLRSKEMMPLISSVRLLRVVLLFQAPDVVTRTTQQSFGVLHPEYGFVQHILCIIGACVSPADDKIIALQLPLALKSAEQNTSTSDNDAELRNSTARRLMEDDRGDSDAIAIANELVVLIAELARQTKNSKWPSEIREALGTSLEGGQSDPVGLAGTRWLTRIGSLYVIGGPIGVLCTGAQVEIKGTRDRATVIDLEKPSKLNLSRANVTQARHRQISQSVCVSIHGERNDCAKPQLWHELVLDECSRFRHLPSSRGSGPHSQSQLDPDSNESMPFVRLHRDDIVCESAAEILDLSAIEYETLFVTSARYLPRALGSIDAEVKEAMGNGLPAFSYWLESHMVVRAALRVASVGEGAARVFSDPNLLEMLLNVSTKNDGSRHFSTAEEVERKLWAVRARVFQVIRGLEKQGDLEVAQWLVNRKSKKIDTTIVEAKIDEPTKPEDGFDLDLPHTEIATNTQPTLHLRLELDVEDPANDAELTSPRTSNTSTTGDADTTVHVSAGIAGADENIEESVDGDDDPNDANGSEDTEYDADENEEEDEEEHEEEDEEDGEESAEHRQEFVDELMMMGFPEEWCVLALKQTENDIVSASAWIVDNLEYLSRLQTSVDKEQDQGTDILASADEDDDDEEEDVKDENAVEDKAAAHGDVGKTLHLSALSNRHDSGTRRHPHSPLRSDGSQLHLVNDKEMGRKIFGEMYFPFDDGGYESNDKSHFFTAWRTEKMQSSCMTAPTPEIGDDGLPAQSTTDLQKPSDTFEQFTTKLRSLELHELLNELAELERVSLILTTRQIVVALLNTKDTATNSVQEMIKLPTFVNFLKLVLFRGDQFHTICSKSAIGSTGVSATVHSSLARTLERTNSDLALLLLDFALQQVEAAGNLPMYEAHLWTQRELRRTDQAVIEEPAVELAVWLFDLVFDQDLDKVGISIDLACSVLQRLRDVLRSSNLPVKFVAIKTMSRVLQQLRQHQRKHGSESAETILSGRGLEIDGFLHAARSRFVREQVQHRTIFSLYLQSFVEILCLLKKLGASSTVLQAQTLLPPIKTSCFEMRDPLSDPIKVDPHQPALAFDLKKCRTSLLQVSDDGLSVSYTGNEMWKTVVTTQSFAKGSHDWQIRIDKSSSSYLFIGVATRKVNLDSFLGADDHSWGFIGDKGLYYQRNRLRVYGDTFGEGDIVGIHLNCELGTLAFSKNGVSFGTAFENVLDEVFPAVAFYSRHQKVSLVPPEGANKLLAGHSAEIHSSVKSDGTVEEAVLVCDMMDCMVSNTPLDEQVLKTAYQMTTAWWNGTGRYIVTRAGPALWVDVTSQACGRFGFKADDRVRSPRGNGRVLGVADERLWIEVEGEIGAWHIHPSRLRTMTLLVRSATEPSHENQSASTLPSPATARDPVTLMGTTSLSNSRGVVDSLTESEFQTYVHDRMWSTQLDRAILSFTNAHCETTGTSPWNISPTDIIRIVRGKAHDIELGIGVQFSFEESDSSSQRLESKILARYGLLRYFNAYLSRVIGFFDSTWQYFSSKSGLLPCLLLSSCRGSVFTSIKNEFFTALMDKTSNSPKKSDDDYDYPDDLTHMMINRPKAATAKCHPGTTKSLLLSMFGQAFEELHFLPLRMLRMVYSHPMDDGQLRTFKVKFEGEGVDDYGGPYREFFSQFFAELQMLTGDEGGVDRDNRADTKDAELGTSFLPFLMPSPNWRNGVGSSREKFVLNGSLLGSSHVGLARVIELATQNASSSHGGWAENAEMKRQLLSEMCHFLGQMIGIALRTRVCIRLDLAMSVWKQLVGEDQATQDHSAARESVLDSLKEVDQAAHTLIRSLQSLHDKYSRCTIEARRAEINEELAAMDLTFTTYLSDGRMVELCDNGNDTVVTMDNVAHYLDLVVEARRNESREVVNVVKQGIHSVIPVAALSVLTWEELEKRLCGVAEVDVELLKENTEYDEDLSVNDEFIQRFWRVLSVMDDEDKRAFLRFVWARSRLPVGTAQFHQKFKIQSLAPSASSAGNENNCGTTSTNTPTNSSLVDGQLPKSHTCFFALQLPRYSNDEVCRKQLLYAIHNCVEMDGDFRLADTEMTGWTEINPNDQLRF